MHARGYKMKKQGGLLSKISYYVIAICALFIIVGFEDAMVAFHKPIDIYSEDFSGVKRFMAVESDLDIIIDNFLEETVTHTKNGSTTSVDRYEYYSVPVFVGDDCYYIALKTTKNGKDSSQISKVVRETMAYLMYSQDTYGSEVLEFTGGVYKMKKNIYAEMKSWFKEAGFFETDAEVEKYVLPYQLETVASFKGVRTMFLVLFAIILLGIFLIVIDHREFTPKAPKNLQNTVINIYGVDHPISKFTKVNQFVVKGKRAQAVAELQKTVTITDMDAENLINHWGEYYF